MFVPGGVDVRRGDPRDVRVVQGTRANRRGGRCWRPRGEFTIEVGLAADAATKGANAYPEVGRGAEGRQLKAADVSAMLLGGADAVISVAPPNHVAVGPRA